MLNTTFLALRILTLFAGFYIPSISAIAQNDRIEGIWFNNEKTAKVEIFKGEDAKLYGKIVWLKKSLRGGRSILDVNNPKPTLRSRPLIGMTVMGGFTKDDEADRYTDGSIYDPKNGKTYNCRISQLKENELDIRGYIGIALMGRKTRWSRVQ